MLLTCPQCGVEFESPIFGGTGTVTFARVATVCPNGHDFNIPDGEYDFISSVITAFRGVTAEDLGKLRALAESAKASTISNDEAVSEAGSINPRFAGLMALLQGVEGWTLLIALISLLLQVMSMRSDDVADAAQLKELKALAQSNAAVAAILSARARPPRPQHHAVVTTPPTHTKTSAQPAANRHERRRLKSDARREGKTSI